MRWFVMLTSVFLLYVRRFYACGIINIETGQHNAVKSPESCKKLKHFVKHKTCTLWTAHRIYHVAYEAEHPCVRISSIFSLLFWSVIYGNTENICSRGGSFVSICVPPPTPPKKQHPTPLNRPFRGEGRSIDGWWINGQWIHAHFYQKCYDSVVYPITHTHGFVCFVMWWLCIYYHPCQIRVICLLIFSRFASMALGQSYDCPSAMEVTLNYVIVCKVELIQSRNKPQKVPVVCLDLKKSTRYDVHTAHVESFRLMYFWKKMDPR